MHVTGNVSFQKVLEKSHHHVGRRFGVKAVSLYQRFGLAVAIANKDNDYDIDYIWVWLNRTDFKSIDKERTGLIFTGDAELVIEMTPIHAI
jgi:hypothetical protein